MRQRYDLVPGGQHRSHGVEIDFTVLRKRRDVDLGAGPLRDELPGNDIAVMFQNRQHDAIAGLQVHPAPAVCDKVDPLGRPPNKYRSEEHTSELPSLMRLSYAVFCLKTKKQH